MTKPAPGQIWRDNDKRYDRHIRILEVNGTARCQRVVATDDGWSPFFGDGRTTGIRPDRFVASSSGYVWVEGEEIRR